VLIAFFVIVAIVAVVAMESKLPFSPVWFPMLQDPRDVAEVSALMLQLNADRQLQQHLLQPPMMDDSYFEIDLHLDLCPVVAAVAAKQPSSNTPYTMASVTNSTNWNVVIAGALPLSVTADDKVDNSRIFVAFFQELDDELSATCQSLLSSPVREASPRLPSSEAVTPTTTRMQCSKSSMPSSEVNTPDTTTDSPVVDGIVEPSIAKVSPLANAVACRWLCLTRSLAILQNVRAGPTLCAFGSPVAMVAVR